MTFLQPLILWGLPLILIPVLIHFINRLRYKPQRWAAMQFLLAASKTAVNRAKLREFLILLFRVLAVAALVFFVSRPLAGGWLGWALTPAPDAIVILLDRSSSMEGQSPVAGETKRRYGLRLAADAAARLKEKSQVVLIENVFRKPEDVPNPALLADLKSAAPSDTASDIPALFQRAVDWLLDTKPGTAEIWVVSDLQASDWKPNDARWTKLSAQIAALPQKVRIKILSTANPNAANTAVALEEIQVQDLAEGKAVQVAMEFSRGSGVPVTIPLQVNVGGASSQLELNLEGEAFRWRHKFNGSTNNAWGHVQLPADANLRDNSIYFVYGGVRENRSLVVSSDPATAWPLRLASANLTQIPFAPAPIVTPSDFGNASLTNVGVVVWQAPLPQGGNAEKLLTWLQNGGTALFFPPGQADGGALNGVSYAVPEQAPDKFSIRRWEEERGPVARADDGSSLPLKETEIKQRALPVGNLQVLASFEDGATFLGRTNFGRGQILFCASLPAQNWSSLAEGQVLVPVVQRLLASAQALNPLYAGEIQEDSTAQGWESVDSAGKDIRLHAGIYQRGSELLALNRPPSEGEPAIINGPTAERLLAGNTVQLWEARANAGKTLQGEIWRVFLAGLLVFLMVEAVLILPPKEGKRK